MAKLLYFDSPRLTVLNKLSEHWTWVDVDFIQYLVGASSTGFVDFLEEMAQEGFIELSDDKTKVRYIRLDYSNKAKTVKYLKDSWYSLVCLVATVIFILLLPTNKILAFGIVAAAFLSLPASVVVTVFKNALKA